MSNIPTPHINAKAGDFARTVRQREVIAKILEKIRAEYSLMDLLRMGAENLDNPACDFVAGL